MQDHSSEEIMNRSTRDMCACSWVQDEFREADFVDRRLFLRFLIVAEHLARLPEAPINQASEGWSKTKAAYRFFDNEKVKAENILNPHKERTKRRMGVQTEPVLVIQDTTFLNFSHMTCSEDLGPIGKLHSKCMGLVMHTSLAISARGLPLGIIDQVIWARDKETHGKAVNRKQRDLEEKESYRWIQALRRYHTILPPSQTLVTICDREGDIYDLFYEAELLKTKFLIRAKHDRSLGNEKLWGFMQQQAIVANYTVEIGAHDQYPSRKAQVEVRFAPVPIRYPLDRPRAERLSDMEAFAVYVSEPNPPFSAEPVDWMLITNVPVNSTDDALERVNWYKLRWQIEIFHRVLKSGCKVEYARFVKNHRRVPYLTLKSIIAWQLLLLTHYHRISPDQSALALMSKIELSALYAAIHDKFPCDLSFTARQAIRWLGQLGGFLARKWDKEPGPTALWRGWQRLQDFTRILIVANPPKSFS